MLSSKQFLISIGVDKAEISPSEAGLYTHTSTPTPPHPGSPSTALDDFIVGDHAREAADGLARRLRRQALREELRERPRRRGRPEAVGWLVRALLHDYRHPQQPVGEPFLRRDVFLGAPLKGPGRLPGDRFVLPCMALT